MQFANDSDYLNNSERVLLHDILVKCKKIRVANITAILRTDLLFDGIPETTIVNLTCFVLIAILFLAFKKISWKYRKYYNRNDLHKIGWISLLYRDVYDFIELNDLKDYGSKYVATDKNLSYLQMLKHIFCEITASDILERCGVDASQYLTFHRYILYFMIYNMVVCLCIVMPSNINGNFGNNVLGGRHFARTTMANLSMESKAMWGHVFVTLLNHLILLCTVSAINKKLRKCGASELKERTVLLKSTSKAEISSASIKKYFDENFPDFDIEKIKLVYDYRSLIIIDFKFQAARENLKNYNLIKVSQSRDIKVSGHSCTILCRVTHCFRKFKKKDGEDVYVDKVKKYEEAMAKELNRIPRTLLPLAYITFNRSASAKKLLAIQPLIPPRIFHRFTGKWAFAPASEPTDIIWENIRHGHYLWTFRALFINLLVFFLAFFVTSPGIVVSSFNLDKLLTGPASNQRVVVSRFLVSLFVMTLSTIIPTIVIYSSDLLGFLTYNSLYKSAVKKTYFFMVLTVILLPSLGQTSLDGFLRWTITTHNQTYDWSCIFLVDNGIFFVDYVMTITFIGQAVNLLKLSEIAWCAYKLLLSQSEAESVSIRKQSIWPFSFGIQYAYSLFVFTMVIFFSLPCPVISVYGMVYFALKYVVDRYNIYYSHWPSRIDQDIHTLALQLLLLSMVFKASGFLFLLYVRGCWGLVITYVAIANLTLSLITCALASGCCSIELFGFLPLGKFKYGLERRNRQENEAQEKEEYQPSQIIKYRDLYKHTDEYENPLNPKDVGHYDSSSFIHSQDVGKKYSHTFTPSV
ncbi:hypothetical protein JTE90_009529 [Oedothorax gibbosus]|uniref:CSC1-like protein 2 n=1 Tax=Oedothorax gibbosus TaxID=931172 RepID=A0AAV6UUD8_9ARAC|nr:hypothetical protein JTE90_009529 [Oedothorax gibbosus]